MSRAITWWAFVDLKLLKMFTLVPQEKRKELIREYRLRLLFIFISLLAALLLIGIILLLPTFLSVKATASEISAEKDSLEKTIVAKSDQDLEKTLGELKQNISALNGMEENIYPTISDVVTSLPSGVSVTGFVYTYGAGGKSLLKVSGIAASRQNLLQFSKNLQAKSEFKTVDLPVSNLAKESSIPYEIHLVGDF